MKQFITFLFSVAGFTLHTNAQLFQNTIGKTDVIEYGESIMQSTDSTYAIAGDYTTNFFASNNSFLMHLKKNGSLDWSRKITPSNLSGSFLSTTHAEAVKAATRPDGYIMIIDVVTTFYVVRLSNSGTVTWARQFNSFTSARKIKPSYDINGALTGFLILAGRDGGANAGGVIMKISTAGSTLWQKRITYAVSGTEYRFADIQATTDGGCILAGNIYQSNKVSTPVLFRISSIGTVLWRFAYILTPNNEIPPALLGVAITNSGYAVTASDGSVNNVTFAVNPAGAFIWAFKYSNSAPLFAYTGGSSIAADASGNLIIACVPQPSPGKNGVVVKLSSGGGVLFAKKFNATSAFRDIKVTNTGTYAAAGYSGPGNDADISVVNISATGTINSGCQPESITLTTALPFTKLLGTPAFGIINETLTNVAVTTTSVAIQTQQSLCSGRQATDVITNEISTNKLQVASDLTAQRVAIKWITKNADNTVYEATLYNNFGQPLTTITLSANQPAYIPMHAMQAGIYSVSLKQSSKLVAREKVVWVK